MQGGGSSIANFFAGITGIVLIGVVLSNSSGVASILNSIGGLYTAAAGAAKPHK
jgi:hypothetical protein